MNRLIPIVLLAAFAISFTSCKRNMVRGKGEVTSTSRTVGGFDKIEIDIPVDVNITVDKTSEHSLNIKTHDNLHQYIKSEIRGNTLHIFSEEWLYGNTDIDLVISTQSLTLLDINGAADAVIKGDIQEKEFRLDISGTAEVDIEELNTDAFLANLNGSSELIIRGGSSNNINFDVNGAGEINAMGLKSKVAKAEVSGAGEMQLNVSDELFADITGAGTIDYKGHPKITSDITGAGTLNDRN